MGRWVTSRGRRIYIPDEGEEIPEKYKKNVNENFKADKKDALGGNKSDKEYKRVLEKHMKEGTHVPSVKDIAKQTEAHIKESKEKYGKASVTELKNLDISKMSTKDKELLYTELGSREFKGERGAKALRDKVYQSLKKGQEDREPKRKRRTAAEIEEENKRIQLHNEKQNALREIVHKGSTITKNKDVADEYKTDNRYSVIEQGGGYKIVKKDWENRVENKYKTSKDQINKDFDTKEKQIANNKKQADILNNKNAVESTTKLSDSNKKAAKQALNNFLWKSDATGEEESVEISSNHFQHANLSNEKMIKVLNVYDTKHEYRLENTSEEKKMMGMKIKVNHQYIVREKKKNK